MVLGGASDAVAAPPTSCDIPVCVVFARSTATSFEYLTCETRSRINYIDPASGTSNAVVGWASETVCTYVGPNAGTTVVGLSIDGDVYACEATEIHMLDVINSCDEFGSNWSFVPGSNHLLLRPVNGFNDTCFDCKPALIEVEGLHTVTFPPGFIPVAYGSACFPSATNPVSSAQCQSNDVGVNE